MTMGPEIFAWIGAAGGLMGWSPEKGCAWRKREGSGGAPLGGDFDLDLHLGLVEAYDDEQRCGRPDLAKHLAADREHGVGILGVGDVIGGAHDIGHRETGTLQRLFDGLEAISRLARDIRRHRHGGVIVAGGAGDEGEIAIDDGAAVAGGLFEWRAGGDETACHRDLDQGFLAVYGFFQGSRNPSLYQDGGCVTLATATRPRPAGARSEERR